MGVAAAATAAAGAGAVAVDGAGFEAGDGAGFPEAGLAAAPGGESATGGFAWVPDAVDATKADFASGACNGSARTALVGDFAAGFAAGFAGAGSDAEVVDSDAGWVAAARASLAPVGL